MADESVVGEPTEATGAHTRGGDALTAWALASFHVAVLLLVPLTVAHAVAPVAVGELLGRLDTEVGVALAVVLWGSTWWSNRRYLAACDFRDTRRTVRAGARWGAVTGLPLLACVVVAVFAATNPFFTLLVLVAGGLVAPLVGGVVGALLAAGDAALDRLAGTLVA